MNLVHSAMRKMRVAGELLSFLYGNKRWWLIPMVMLLVMVAILVVLAQTSAIGPFIYTLF